MRTAVILALLSPLLCWGAVQREDIGVLKIHDLLLRPYFQLAEPQDGSFSIGESSFALRWELEDIFSGVIRLGPRSLLNPSARFSQTVNDDVLLVEAFAEINHPYGRFRLGRLPVEFGYEGKLWERHLIFPRSLLFANRTVMLRDVGGSYEIRHNNFFTGFVVHNGESDSDVDGRIWYTARWGYSTEKFEVGMTGQTGSTKGLATNTSNDTLAGVDPTRDAQWRIGGIHGVLFKKTWQWVLEYYMGDRIQEDVVGRFLTGHNDLSFDFTRYYSLHLRYDVFDPNRDQSGDRQQRASVAFVMHNKTRSSNLIFVGSKVMEESSSADNDEMRVIWSLSPSGIVRF